jgi:ribosome-binding protein aMBF1 (putative translation factor)
VVVKLFLAWSGVASERLAEFMREWLPSVVQAIEPFMSSQDIRKGQRWANEIGASLSTTQFALLCLTPANLNSRWIHFEAGAAMKMEQGRVSALLFDVSPTEVEYPLQQFQHTQLTKDDLWKLIRDLNRLCPAPLGELQLRRSFERSYPDVVAEFDGLRKILAQEHKGGARPVRSTEAILTDLLTIQQGIESKLDTIHKHVRRSRSRRSSSASSPRTSPPSATPETSLPKKLFSRRFGEILRQTRLARGWSQATLASKSRVDRTYLSQIECGIHSPTVSVLYKLSRALDVAPSALVSRLERHFGRETGRAPPSRMVLASSR